MLLRKIRKFLGAGPKEADSDREGTERERGRERARERERGGGGGGKRAGTSVGLRDRPSDDM